MNLDYSMVFCYSMPYSYIPDFVLTAIRWGSVPQGWHV